MQDERFNNPKYINWIKVTASLNILKEGLEEFVESQSETLHQQLSASVQLSLAPGTVCTQCHWSDITCANANSRRSRYTLACPNGVCNVWLKEILKLHSTQPHLKVEWKNTDPQLWPTKPWEVVKCFQPYGCQGNTSARDSDCASLLTIFTDCLFFQQFVLKVQTVRDVKDIRNKTMHSASQEVDDCVADLDAMISLLEDPKQFMGLSACTEAVQKIKQLHDCTMTIALLKEAEEPALQQRDLALSTEIERLTDELTTLKSQTAENTELSQQLKVKVDEVERRISVLGELRSRLEELESSTSDGAQTAEETRHKLKDLTSSVDKQAHELRRHGSCIEKLSNDIDALSNSFRWSAADLHIPSDVMDSRTFLLDLYDQQYSEVPVYPSLLDETLSLKDLYVPSLIKIDSDLTGIARTGSRRKAAYFYSDILSPSSTSGSRLNRNIYLVGETGTGKTTFCMRMLQTWCRAHRLHEMGNELSKDEEYMRSFDLLFYLPLKAFRSFGKVELMIEQLMEQPMTDILRRANCLIILDGLDEWEPPPGYQPSLYMTSGLPTIGRSNRYTILTTTRNWKLEVVRPIKKDISQLVEILGVEAEAAVEIASILVGILNKKSGKRKDVNLFVQEMRAKKLDQFMSTPVILTQMVCLWHDGKPFGNSQCKIYANMLDRQFELAQFTRNIESLKAICSLSLPDCFKDAKTCLKYQKELIEIAKLAYQEWTHPMKENPQTESDIVKLCLKLGLLSLTKVYTKSSEICRSVSFIHKTYQDFLAALHLCGSKGDNVDVTISNMCSSVNNLLEMATVLQFLCGMNPKKGTQLLQESMKVVSTDSRIIEYRYSCENSLQNYDIVVNIQEMLLDIEREISGIQTATIRLPVKDLIINAGTLNIDHCLSDLKIEDLLSLNINTVAVSKKMSENINTFVRHLKLCSRLQMLHVVDCLGKLQVMDLYSLTLLSCRTLTNVWYEGLDLSKLSLNIFHGLNLTSIALVNVKLNDTQQRGLTDCLSNMTGLTVLYLINTEIAQTSLTPAKSLTLSRLDRLQSVSVQNMNISDIELNPTSLTTCVIHSQIPRCVESVVLCFGDGACLQELTIKHCRHPNLIKELVRTVPLLVNIITLRLERADLSQIPLILSAKMKQLQHLSFVYVAFSSETFDNLVDSFPEHVFTVELEFVTVCMKKRDDDFVPVERYLRNQRETVCKMNGIQLFLKANNQFQFYSTNVLTEENDTATQTWTYIDAELDTM